MKKQLIIEILILLALSVIISFLYSYITQQGFFHSNTTQASSEKFQVISLEDAKEAFFTKGTVFIDARHEFEYNAGHIRKAINIPLHALDRYQLQLSEIPKDALIVIYCDGAQCNSSLELAARLADFGFSNLKVFFGGWQEWTTAGLPTAP